MKYLFKLFTKSLWESRGQSPLVVSASVGRVTQKNEIPRKLWNPYAFKKGGFLMGSYDEILSRAEELQSSGLHCSQVMLLLSHEMRDIENPELIRALAGLGGGLFCRLTCGTLTGGCCLLSSFGAKGSADEPESINYKGLVIALTVWFQEEFGSTLCSDLVETDRAIRREVCPKIVAKTFVKCMELLTEADIDVYE